MTIVKTEKIVGYLREDEIYCLSCAIEERVSDIHIDEVITDDKIDTDEKVYFCDICKKMLKVN